MAPKPILKNTEEPEPKQSDWGLKGAIYLQNTDTNKVADNYNPHAKDVEDSQIAIDNHVDKPLLTKEQEREIIERNLAPYANWEKGQSVADYLRTVAPPKPFDEKAAKRAKTFGAIGDMAMALSDAITLGKGGNIPKQRATATPSVLKAIEAEKARNAKYNTEWQKGLREAGRDDAKDAREYRRQLALANRDAEKEIYNRNKDIRTSNDAKRKELNKNLTDATRAYNRYEGQKALAQYNSDVRIKEAKTKQSLGLTGRSGRRSGRKSNSGGGYANFTISRDIKTGKPVKVNYEELKRIAYFLNDEWGKWAQYSSEMPEYIDDWQPADFEKFVKMNSRVLSRPLKTDPKRTILDVAKKYKKQN